MYQSAEQMERMGFSFYYPEEENEGKYFQTPKQLFECPFYKKYLTSTEREIYALLKDRKNLSSKKENREKYTDEKGRVFIVYTRQQIMDYLSISKPTCVEAFKKLTMCGLIFEKRQGRGQANLIYVLKVKYFTDEEAKLMIEETENLLSLEKSILPKKSKKLTSKEKAPKKPKKEVKKLKNLTSRSKKFLPQEVKKFNPNNTNTNNTDINKTDINNSTLSILEQSSLKEILNTVNVMLENKIGITSYKTYIAGLKIEKLEGNKITYGVINNFTKEIIHTRYNDFIIKCFKAVGYDVLIDYKVSEPIENIG